MSSIGRAGMCWLVATIGGTLASSMGWAATSLVPLEYATIQAGLDAAAAGDTVLVAPGTYVGPGNVGLMYGRDLVLMSERGPEETVIDIEGTWNVGGVRFWNAETRAAVLDGFTITRGGGFDGTVQGGGISCFTGSPTIRNCILIGNVVGIWIAGSPLVENCLLEGNFPGVRIEGSSVPEITGCTIRDGSSGLEAFDDSRSTIRNCIFSGNRQRGVVLSSWLGSELLNCEITGNGEGGVYGGDVNMVGCTIAGNQKGGLVVWQGNATIDRSIIWGNCAENGNDVYVDGFQVSLTCCAWPDSGVYTLHGGQVISNGPQVKTDPRYCAPLVCPPLGHGSLGGDYTLRSDSPCLPEFSPCHEPIGYRGLGCQAPEEVGACCLDSTLCVLATSERCAEQHGIYVGNGASCYPSACVQIPVKESSWGQIKTRFR